MTEQPRRRRGAAFRIALGVGSFAALFLFARPAEIGRVLAGASLPWLGVAFALCLLVLLIRTYRWWRLLIDFGLSAPFRLLLESMMVSSFFNLFLPGSVGGDASRAYDLARYSSKKLRPVATVVVERFTGVLALFLIGPAAVWLARGILPLSPPLLMAAGLTVLAAATAALVAGLHAETIFARLRPLLPDSLLRRLPAERLDAIFGVARDLRGRPWAFVRACATGVVLQVIVLSAYYAMSLALRGNIPPLLFFSFFPIIEFVSLIPITVNGLGVREGLTVWFLEKAAVPASFSMGLSIVNRLITLVLGALGGLVLLARRPGGLRRSPP
jgi:hypothetical protein